MPRGQVFGFLGPNGAGKTTAIKVLVGSVRSTSGEAWPVGRALSERRARRRVGYQPSLSASEVLC